MALKPLQAMLPFGQFDGYDSEYTLITGGEVVTLVSIATGSDLAAADVDNYDGYGTVIPVKRPVITTNVQPASRPLWLADEGTNGYGTIFGEVVGAVAGRSIPVPGKGVNKGLHSAEGSGKVTVWNYKGLYSITLDSVDATAGTGLVPENTALEAGTALYAETGTGKLTPTDPGSSAPVVARFIEFGDGGSLVTTPRKLVDSSPTVSELFDEVTIYWEGV